MSIQVAVTEPEFRKGETAFGLAANDELHFVPVVPDEERLAGELRRRGIQHAIVGVSNYRGALYEAIHPGGVIARFGVGHDGVNKELATARGILCTNTPGVLDDSVAEHAMGLICALARHTTSHAARLIAGDWSPCVGVELKGKTLAIIGCGGIGRRVGRMASLGFGMKVVGLRKSRSDSAELQEHFGFERVVTDFEDAVAGADFVSLHLPGAPETLRFLDRSRMAKLPVGSCLINTARGAIVEEPALFDALGEGRIAGAALDVFEKEPYEPQVPGKDLRKLPNVILTPHIGSSTREACDRMAARSVRNIQLAVAGRFAEMDLLNPAVLPAIQSS